MAFCNSNQASFPRPQNGDSSLPFGIRFLKNKRETRSALFRVLVFAVVFAVSGCLSSSRFSKEENDLSTIEKTDTNIGRLSFHIAKTDNALKSIKVFGKTSQEGTGHPSPDNPRPLSGAGEYDRDTGKYKLSARISDDKGTQTITASFDSPLYDGDYLDLVSGQVYRGAYKDTITDSRPITRNENSGHYVFRISGGKVAWDTEKGRGFSNIMYPGISPITPNQSSCYCDNSIIGMQTGMILLLAETINSVDGLKEFLRSTPIEYIGYRREPVMEQATLSSSLREMDGTVTVKCSDLKISATYSKSGKLEEEDRRKGVTVGDKGTYSSLLAALKCTPDDTKITVLKGTYDIIEEYKAYYGENYFDNYDSDNGTFINSKTDPFVFGLRYGNGREIEFEPGSVVKCHYTGNNTDVNRYFSAFAPSFEARMINCDLEYSGIRYAVHDDFAQSGGTTLYDNCRFVGNPFYSCVIGGGCGKNNTYIIKDCVFEIEETGKKACVSYHNNKGSEGKCVIVVEGCRGNGICQIVNHGNSKEITYCVVTDCDFYSYRCGKNTLAPNNPDNMIMIRNNDEGSTDVSVRPPEPARAPKPSARIPLNPTAVPVLTPQEAEKANSEALVYAATVKEKREPFYQMYEDSQFETITFEGTVKAVSTIPDPEQNDYANCLYALFVELDSVGSNTPASEKVASEIVLTVPIMKEKKVISDYKFFPGDKVLCTCAEYDSMPQDIQEIQLSDDIQSFEHQQYYAFGISKIDSFSKNGNRNFAKREITILPVQTLPKDERAAALRKERIQNEIARIEEELKKHGGTFEKWKEEYQPIANKFKKLCDAEWSGWIGDSFFAAGGKTGIESGYDTKGYINGIKPYKEYLEKNNIDLIVLRVPSKGDFAARVLMSDDFQENPAWVEHYYECLKNDIEIVDPMPEMWKERFDFPLFYFYHILPELHPCEGAAFASAKALSQVLQRYSFPKTNDPISLEDTILNTYQARFFWPEGNAKFDPKSNISFKKTVQNNAPVGSFSVNSGSPFLFLSNSLFYFPSRPLGACLPGYTAYFLQTIPDWFYQEGLGNQMIRNLIADSAALSNRSVVIMSGHPTCWKGDFLKMPQYIDKNAKSIVLEQKLSLLSPDITIDKNGFSFQETEDGFTSFSSDVPAEFSIEMNIPNKQGKNECMLRFNFETNDYISIEMFDRNDNSVIDTFTLPRGDNQNADLFVPVSNEPRKVLIHFIPSRPANPHIVKSIEFWYY